VLLRDGRELPPHSTLTSTSLSFLVERRHEAVAVGGEIFRLGRPSPGATSWCPIQRPERQAISHAPHVRSAKTPANLDYHFAPFRVNGPIDSRVPDVDRGGRMTRRGRARIRCSSRGRPGGPVNPIPKTALIDRSDTRSRPTMAKEDRAAAKPPSCCIALEYRPEDTHCSAGRPPGHAGPHSALLRDTRGMLRRQKEVPCSASPAHHLRVHGG
jgi:hypothetical protein